MSATLAPALREELLAHFGQDVTRAERVHGGDINEAYSVTLGDGSSLFVKTHARPPAGMYLHEARGLAWLGEARALRVPRVLFASERALVLEWIDSAPRAQDHDEALGRGLAALHRAGAPSFGFAQDGYLATLRTDNGACATWAEFYGERRLRPLLRMAEARGVQSRRMRRGVEALIERLPELVGPDEPPSRLHGDLWGGNAMTDERGAPMLIDPAPFGGHREIDLAMMKLFGGFSPRVFDAYDEAHPRASGHEGRVQLYQLLPLLAHVALFGAGYVASVERALDAYL